MLNPRLFIVVTLVLLATTASSGCIFGCSIHSRAMTWSQEDFPEEMYHGAVSYHNGKYGGSVQLEHETKTFTLIVDSTASSVPHDDFVEFAYDMFEAKGWPTPELDGEEETFCSDEI